MENLLMVGLKIKLKKTSLIMIFCQDYAVNQWIGLGADSRKLVLGIPNYGRSFKLASSSNWGIGASAGGTAMSGPFTKESGYLGYNEVRIDFLLKNLPTLEKVKIYHRQKK